MCVCMPVPMPFCDPDLFQNYFSILSNSAASPLCMPVIIPVALHWSIGIAMGRRVELSQSTKCWPVRTNENDDNSIWVAGGKARFSSEEIRGGGVLFVHIKMLSHIHHKNRMLSESGHV